MPDAKLTDDASDQCLHELIEAAAQARPGLPAVVAGEFRLTYSDLDQRASSLADCLTTRGVGPESIVGVHLPKTPEAIVAMLAVLKAGAAFTPLDPARPGGQLARLPLDAIISDSAVPPATLGRDLLVLASSAAGPARGQPAQDRPAGRGARAAPEPGLCHLHLRIDRGAQGRGGRALVDRQVNAGQAAPVRAGAFLPAAVADRV